MKIAIIQLDPDFVPLQNGDQANFAQLGESLLRQCLLPISNSTDVEYTTFNYSATPTAAALPPFPEQFDVIYLTGSKYDSYIDNDFNITLITFLQEILNSKKMANTKLLGICYGHQLIARALGLQTLPNPHPQQWEIGNVRVIDGALGDFVISEVHRDVVQCNDQTLTLLQNHEIQSLGRSEDNVCALQGLYKSGKLLTFQGHPEFDKDVTMWLAELEFQRGYISESYLDDVKKRYRDMIEDSLDERGNKKLQCIIRDFIE